MNINNTHYHEETSPDMITVLESVRQLSTRVRIYYGDVNTGQCWNEEHDVLGYIGRSTGTVKIPLMIYNTRSLGGPGLLGHCILKIKASKTGQVLYQHPKFIEPVVTRQGKIVYIDGQLYGHCKTESKAIWLERHMR